MPSDELRITYQSSFEGVMRQHRVLPLATLEKNAHETVKLKLGA